MFEYNTI